MRLVTLRTALAVLSCAVIGANLWAADDAAKADPLDWYNWRGPEQNRISREKGLPDKFDPYAAEPVNLLWKNDEAAGISTPIVMRGKLYTIVRHARDTVEEQEKVLCLDAATGKKIWENKFNVYLSDVPADRVGWSNCAGDPTTGRIYVQGVCGYFQCIDGETGKTLWSHSMHEEFGALSTYGGRTNVPVVYEDLVIISAVMTNWGDFAVPAHTFVAFDKNTGEVRWINRTKPRPEDTTYSTPTLTVLNGQAAMVFGSGDGGVYAWQPRTGKPIWNYQLSKRGLNSSPAVVGDVVYAAHGEENSDNLALLGGVVALDGSKTGDITKTGVIWKVNQIMVNKSNPLVINERLYVVDDSAKMYVMDAKTGKQLGQKITLYGTIMRGSPLFADGKIYVAPLSGWHVFQPTSTGVKKLDALRLDLKDDVTGSPSVSHGRIYLPTGGTLYCIGSKDQTPSADPLPPAPQEKPKGADDKPAFAQLSPADALLKPGQTVNLTVRLFNDRGQLLSEKAAAKFTLAGPGDVSAEGAFTAAAGEKHTATIVTAEVDGLKATARFRVVPPLPWTWSFADATLDPTKKTGEPPITWIGCRYRHVIRELEGEKVMVKVTTIPKGTRSQSWMGHPDMHDYTIQADIRGATANNKLPDMGLIAQRYTLDIMGASQQLQLRTWTAQIHKRFSKNVPFTWTADKWYTVKFKASVIDEKGTPKALLQGKVWPKGEKEPAEWTIEATDAVPNVTGSPGLFGNANDAEIYFNNITVTPNSAK